MTIVLILSERNRPAEMPIMLPAMMAPVFTSVPVNGKPLKYVLRCNDDIIYFTAIESDGVCLIGRT